jgi:hypothetical protein
MVSVADLIADDRFSSGDDGGDGDGGFRRGGGGGGSVGANGGGGGGGVGGRPKTSDLALLAERRPDCPGLEKRGGEEGAGDMVAPGEDGYDGVLTADPGEAVLERSRAATAAWTAAASVRCELDVLDDPRGE